MFPSRVWNRTKGLCSVSFSLKAHWFIRTKIIVKKDGDGTVPDMVLVALLCAVQDPFPWSYLNHEAENNSNWHSVTKHCGNAIIRSLFGEDDHFNTSPESSWEPCQVRFQYKCISHGPVKCGNCFDSLGHTCLPMKNPFPFSDWCMCAWMNLQSQVGMQYICHRGRKR